MKIHKSHEPWNFRLIFRLELNLDSLPKHIKFLYHYVTYILKILVTLSYIVYLNDFADERKDGDAMRGVGKELSSFHFLHTFSCHSHSTTKQVKPFPSP